MKIGFNETATIDVINKMNVDIQEIISIAKKIQQETQNIVGNDWAGKDSEAFSMKIEELTKMVEFNVADKATAWGESVNSALNMLQERERAASTIASSLPGGF